MSIKRKKAIFFLYAVFSLLLSAPLLTYLSRWTAVSPVSEASEEEIYDYSIRGGWEYYYVERGRAYEWRQGVIGENRLKFTYCLIVFFFLAAPFLYQFIPFAFSVVKKK